MGKCDSERHLDDGATKLDAFIRFRPILAKRFGTRGALLLELLNFRSQLIEADDQGLRWVPLTYRELIDIWFPCVSESALRTSIDCLVREKVVLRKHVNSRSYWRGLCYALVHDELSKLGFSDIFKPVDSTKTKFYNRRNQGLEHSIIDASNIRNQNFKNDKETLDCLLGEL
jgi:hypothetical protein